MEKEVLDAYKKAGRIAAEARELAVSLAKPDAKLLEIAEKVEEFIRKSGAAPAFPVNISINEIAAHYTPIANDASDLKAGDIIKFDIGASVDGYVADTAKTVVVGGADKEKQKMVDTINKALESALKVVRPGIKVGEIGAEIERVITAAGYKPIRNLSGHLIERFDLHAGVTIPNVKIDLKDSLEVGKAYAIEPFLTDANGSGIVKESEKAVIYKYVRDGPVRTKEAREILHLARDVYNGLPFAIRWIKGIPPFVMATSLQKLVEVGALYKYGVLKEAGGGLVAQAEHTIVMADKPIVITKID